MEPVLLKIHPCRLYVIVKVHLSVSTLLEYVQNMSNEKSYYRLVHISDTRVRSEHEQREELL